MEFYNPFSLSGKTVLVTGASSGIGKSTAIECSRLGARVVITGRSEKRLSETLEHLEEGDHLAIQADLTNADDLVKLVRQVPLLDGLVNNAGITITVPTPFINREKLDRVFETNTVAPMLLTQKILKAKKIGKGGSIVFTCSISGTCVSGCGNVLYSASKGAIHGFMKNAALDLSVKGIRVNEVCPGIIDTHIMDESSISSDMLEIERGRYPMKRFGKPEEVAYAIIYFLSDASAFTTGSSLVVDGGFTLR